MYNLAKSEILTVSFCCCKEINMSLIEHCPSHLRCRNAKNKYNSFYTCSIKFSVNKVLRSRNKDQYCFETAAPKHLALIYTMLKFSLRDIESDI